jgi:hypothetical protein
MSAADDEEVLKFIGRRGRTSDAISERFPGFDMLRLVRAGLVEGRDAGPEVYAHTQISAQVTPHYTLTERGATAVGVHVRARRTA